MKKVYLTKIKFTSNETEFLEVYENREKAIEYSILFIKQSFHMNKKELKLLEKNLKEKSFAYKAIQVSNANYNIEVRCDIFEKYIIS